MFRILLDLRFTETEAQVYLYLMKEGPQRAENVAKALNLGKQRLYLSLGKMQSEGIIQITPDHPALFLVVPFEKVLDLLIRANIKEAKRMMQNKKELLSSWSSITEKDEEKS
jgi:sugar-specific transcriptional regulator TrmB